MFVWNFYGEIIFAAVNFPDTWHDSKLPAASCLYYPLLSRYTPTEHAVMGDSAFPRSEPSLHGKMLRARKTNEIGISVDIFLSAWLSAVDNIRARSMHSDRESAEWGVMALKGLFKRLTVPLAGDSYNRYRITAACAHICNFRTGFIGLNQITTISMRKVSLAVHH